MVIDAQLRTVLRHMWVKPSKPCRLACHNIAGPPTEVSWNPLSTNMSVHQDTPLRTLMFRSWIRKYADMSVE